MHLHIYTYTYEGTYKQTCIHTHKHTVYIHIHTYILVMQCFRVGYCGIYHLSLVFSVYTRAFRRVCIRRKYKWHVPFSMVSHEKPLHNYFIPCLDLRKTYGDFGKSSETSSNFRKLLKRFKPVFEEHKRFMKLLKNFGNSSKVFSRCFYDFFNFPKIFGNLRKCSEILGNFRKTLETVQSNFQMFLWLFKIFGKSSEIFGCVRKSSGTIFGCDVIGNVRNGSQELKDFGDRFWEVLQWTSVNCCVQGMTGK